MLDETLGDYERNYDYGTKCERNVETLEPSNALQNVSLTLAGQLLSVKKIFEKVGADVPNETAVQDGPNETAETHDDDDAALDNALDNAVARKRDLLRGSQIYQLLGAKEGSGCAAALIQLFSERFDKERGVFKVNKRIEIRFCGHRVAYLLSINDTGKGIQEFEKKKERPRLPDFVDDLKKLFVTKHYKKVRRDREDMDKIRKRIKRDLSANSLIQILNQMPVDTDERRDQYRQLVRLYVVEQIFLPSSESKYIRSSSYKYCEDGPTFESINWAQAILDLIYVAIEKNTRTFAACSSAFQALIYDKMPSLIPDENKLKMTAVPADKYPLIRKNKEMWKLELDKLSSKEIKNCDICSGHDGFPEHDLGGPLFQKACEGLILARVIEKARKTLEGSLEGDYLSEFNDINLVDELKMKYVGMDDTSDWGLLEALSTKDAAYTEPMTSDILNLSSSSKIIKKVVASDVELEVEMEGLVETKDATGGGDADHEKVVTDKVATEKVVTDDVPPTVVTPLIEEDSADPEKGGIKRYPGRNRKQPNTLLSEMTKVDARKKKKRKQ
ncbi:hypothetical protein POM88_019329 [Heracleum sosnowskyi]|uniref:Uncharacterized protein n=1 Tax=Heracleum sosnowskyi TaxID=360622 RepID=A0AAD8IUM1_9APIA|nr:hypothetical protein POM88_019329 [Heracleum sosnowskyi]